MVQRFLIALVITVTSIGLNACVKRPEQSAQNRKEGQYVRSADVRLLFAAIKCDVNSMDAALKSGADVNAIVEGTGPALVVMCGDTNAAKLLLDNGADANMADSDGYTPILAATLFDRREVVRLLISKGADVNAATYKGKNGPERLTPLMIAKKEGHKDLVQLLTEAGAKE